MKSGRQIMNLLRDYELCGSLRSAGELNGCSPNTVKRYAKLRVEGGLGDRGRSERTSVIDPYRAKIGEWVLHTDGRVRADKAHRKLVAMGYRGSERTTRRAVARARLAHHKATRRVYRPWIPEPGMWAQFDWADAGTLVDGERVHFFCAGLAWSRLRVVIPTRNRKLATVICCLDQTMRVFGGVPSYWLTDNERTICSGRVAGVPIKHPVTADFARHYGTSIEVCVPADPESKGFSEAIVRVAKADLLPTGHNLRSEYASWEELELACEEFTQLINSRPHSVTRRRPLIQLIDGEATHLHPLPREPYTAAFGVTRRASSTSMVRWRNAYYSVPHTLAEEIVWVRTEGSELVVVADRGGGFAEAARHQLAGEGAHVVCEGHYPESSPGPLNRRPKPRSEREKSFLAIGPGAERWLQAAAAAGAPRIRKLLDEAIDLARLYGRGYVSDTLAIAGKHGCFRPGDIEAILRDGDNLEAVARCLRAADADYLQPGTAAWKRLGGTPEKGEDA